MKNVQDIYSATPMQEAMLLHALSCGANDTLFNQFCYTLNGSLDVERFTQAWEQLLARHAALRTAFLWERVKSTQQVVRKTSKLTVSVDDWRNYDEQRQTQQIDKLLVDDRQQAFSLNKAPLMRVTLRRLQDQQWLIVWSSHHLVLDRWCLGTLFADLDQLYQATQSGSQTLAPVRSFRDYVDWIKKQDKQQALQYWAHHLQGVRRSTQLTVAAQASSAWSLMAVDSNPAPPNSMSSQAERLSAVDLASEEFQSLQQYAKLQGVTMGAVVQGAWALLLNCVTSQQDVIFGTAVSGRPTDLQQVDAIVGSFVNNVPMRVSLQAGMSLRKVFQHIQQAQLSRGPFEYLSPAQIISCAPLTEHSPNALLYDNLVVWLMKTADPKIGDLTLKSRGVNYGTSYPLTLSVEEHDDSLRFILSSERLTAGKHQQLLLRLLSIVRQIVSLSAGACVDDLDSFTVDVSATHEPISDSSSNAFQPLPSSLSMPQFLKDHTLQGGRERLPLPMMIEFLSSQWSAVLDVQQIEKDEDFFELGGTSLQAAMLHQQVEAALRKSVPLLALFKTSTIVGMAQTLIGEDWPLHANLVTPLRASSKTGALFCVASPEVSTLGYFLLSRYLPVEQAMYVVQSPPVQPDLIGMHPREVPQYAETYWQAMQQVEPHGPYKILTMCGGSHISLEIARLAERANERVEFLGVINTWAMYTVSKRYYLNRLKNIARYYISRCAQMLPGSSRGRVAMAGNVATTLAPQVDAGMVEEDVGIDNPWISEYGFESRDPNRDKIRSEITVFRLGPQQSWRIRDKGLGWNKHSSNVAIVNLEGHDHNAILREPCVQHFARQDTART